MRTALRDAVAIGRPDAQPPQQQDIERLLDELIAKAFNADQDASDALGALEDKIKRQASGEPGEPGDLLAVFISGLHAGSVAVARQWVRASPATAIGYWSGYGTHEGAVLVPAKKDPN